jgi:hypothetical protein
MLHELNKDDAHAPSPQCHDPQARASVLRSEVRPPFLTCTTTCTTRLLLFETLLHRLLHLPDTHPPSCNKLCFISRTKSNQATEHLISSTRSTSGVISDLALNSFSLYKNSTPPPNTNCTPNQPHNGCKTHRSPLPLQDSVSPPAAHDRAGDILQRPHRNPHF